MRPLLLALLLAFPALADWPEWEATCSAAHPGCFEELAARSKDCKVMRKRTAETTRGKTAIEWRRCPLSGFQTVRGADYVVVTGEAGSLWAFNNVVDPSNSAVHDVVFVGKKLIWVQATHRNTGGANWCLLSLAAEVPRCVAPAPQELEPREQALLRVDETLQGTQWTLVDVQPSRVRAERPIFAAGRQSGVLRATLKVRAEGLAIDKLTRD